MSWTDSETYALTPAVSPRSGSVQPVLAEPSGCTCRLGVDPELLSGSHRRVQMGDEARALEIGRAFATCSTGVQALAGRGAATNVRSR